MIGKNTRRVGLYKGLLQRAAKNKITEFLNFLDKHNTDIAIITETCLTPTDKIRIRNYNIHRKDGSLPTSNKRNSQRYLSWRYTYLYKHRYNESKTQAHTPTHDRRHIHPSQNQNDTNTPRWHHPHKTGHFTIGGGFNVKHSIWNNLNRNGSTIKNHLDLRNYQIIDSPTYTHKQPHCTPTNIDIFLANIP